MWACWLVFAQMKYQNLPAQRPVYLYSDSLNYETSAPGYPQINEHAEAFVKKVTYLITKVSTGSDLDDKGFDRGGLMGLRK